MTQTIRLHQNRQWETADSAFEGLTARPRSLYVHIPFCFHKCHYCDFYSFVDSQDRQAAFTETLITELGTLARRAGGGGEPVALDTVFIGGGTPTLLRTDLWERLLEALHRLYVISRETEFTVESNPETTTREVVEALARGGVNRLSVGAQTFHPTHLKTLERHHDPANVRRALEFASEAGIERRSIDLIFAIPGQSLSEWRADLETAIGLGGLIDHISAYNLMYEPNTALTKRLSMGQFEAVGEETEIEMYEHTRTRLRESGFESYEISNYAKAGSECRHNMAYWLQHDWLAAGPSASAHLNGWRWKNIPHLGDWMTSVSAKDGFAHVVDLEPPDARRALAELLMTGVRLTRGFDASTALARAESIGVRQDVEDAAQSLVRDGIITIACEVYTLTDEGQLLADEAGSRFIGAVSLD